MIHLDKYLTAYLLPYISCIITWLCGSSVVLDLLKIQNNILKNVLILGINWFNEIRYINRLPLTNKSVLFQSANNGGPIVCL